MTQNRLFRSLQLKLFSKVETLGNAVWISTNKIIADRHSVLAKEDDAAYDRDSKSGIAGVSA